MFVTGDQCWVRPRQCIPRWEGSLCPTKPCQESSRLSNLRFSSRNFFFGKTWRKNNPSSGKKSRPQTKSSVIENLRTGLWSDVRVHRVVAQGENCEIHAVRYRTCLELLQTSKKMEIPLTARFGLCHIWEISVLVSKATRVSFISSLRRTMSNNVTQGSITGWSMCRSCWSNISWSRNNCRWLEGTRPFDPGCCNDSWRKKRFIQRLIWEILDSFLTKNCVV